MTQRTCPPLIKRFAITAAGALAAIAIALGLASCAAPSIPEEDVVGVWNVTESNGTSMADMNEQGIYTLYEFKEDGVFTMTGLVQEQSMAREGTWQIDGEKVLVSVPATEEEPASGDGPIVSLSAEPIENAEVTIEDGLLTTNAIGNSAVTAKRIDNTRHQEILDQAASYAPQQISVGEQISTDVCTFTIDSFGYQDTILPSNTSGFYTYYDDQADSTYLVAHFSYTNNASSYAVIGYATKAQFNVGGNTYEASIELDGGTLFGRSYRLEAKQAGTGVIYAAIPDSVKNSPDATLTWSIPDDPQYLNTYYQDSFDSTSYELTL